MEAVKLKLKLVEMEKAYRERFFNFVQVLKRAAEDHQHTKSKTIMKICQEVLSCSDGLLLALDNRERISQQSEGIYKVFEEHHFSAVGILSVYCTNLLDIRSLLLSSPTTDCSELKFSRYLNEALQPVLHIEEVLNLLADIKEHLTAKRRLVEIFSCNSLTDQLTKGLQKLHRAVEDLHAEELVLALQDMSVNVDASPHLLAAASLAEDSEVSNADTLPETSTRYAERRWSTGSSGNRRNLKKQNGAVLQSENGRSVCPDETAHCPEQSQGTEFGAEDRRFENQDYSASLVEGIDFAKTEILTETSTSHTQLQKTTARESNDTRERECTDDSGKEKVENEGVRNADNGSSQSQSTVNSIVAVTESDFPDNGMHVKRKPPIPCPRAKRSVHSVQNEGNSAEGVYVKNSQTETVVLRRESKKSMLSKVQTISMKISQMKSDLSSLKKKIDSIESLGSLEDSESDDQGLFSGTGEYPDDFKESANAVAQKVDANCSGVNLRSASVHYDAGLRDRRTKHLLHSAIWQVPLYQEYHVDVATETTASDAATGAQEEKPEGVEATKIVDSNDRYSRPESGIVMEGEGDVDEPMDSYYTPMWNKGSRLEECSVDYVRMGGIRHSKRCSYVQLNPDCVGRKWEEIEHSSTSMDSLTCPYTTMNRTYANMCFGNLSEIQDGNVYSSVHDIFGAVQVEKEAFAQETFGREEVTHIVPPTQAKQMPGWCNIPAVKESGVLANMTKREKHLQEAKYELISSKVSYLKSLSVLQAIFIENVHLKRLMTATEWDNLFQFIGPIKQCSEHFLADLLSGWPQDMFMSNQLLVVRQYALTGLQTYVNYCSNKVTMDKTLSEIRSNNQKVNCMLRKLERDEICDNNTLESFLVLPIQRITRFPLLVEGILCRMDSNADKDFCAWAKTYRELVEMAKRCNDAVRQSEESAEISLAAVPTIASRNRINAPFTRSSKSTTLTKRKRSIFRHDSGQ